MTQSCWMARMLFMVIEGCYSEKLWDIHEASYVMSISTAMSLFLVVRVLKLEFTWGLLPCTMNELHKSSAGKISAPMLRIWFGSNSLYEIDYFYILRVLHTTFSETHTLKVYPKKLLAFVGRAFDVWTTEPVYEGETFPTHHSDIHKNHIRRMNS